MKKPSRVLLLLLIVSLSALLATAALAAAGETRRTRLGSADLPSAPALVLTKTVGLASGPCSTTDFITVVPGANVRYCYEAANTGTVTFTAHTLTDTVLGVLFDGLAIVLPPGASTIYSTTTQIVDPVTNQATWEADDGIGGVAQAVDSATVDIFEPDLTLSKTATTTPGSCPGVNSLQIIPGAPVHYCYILTNTGPVTLTSHTLTDSHLGLLLLGQPAVVSPAGTFVFSTTEIVTQSVTNIGTWTADDGFGHLAADSDSASVTVLQPSIALVKTVSAAPGICAPTKSITVSAGSDVTYCYEIENTGQVTVTNHSLFDDQLGALITDTLAVVRPGETYLYSTTVPLFVDTVNTATWTASEPFGNAAQAVDTASVTVTTPGLELAKTVGTGTCPASESISVVPGSTVQYCFELQNTGTTTFTTQTLVDDHLGTLLFEQPIEIPPGGSHLVTATSVITQPVTNLATWTAVDIFSSELQDSDTASVDITGVDLGLVKTVSAVSGVCAETTTILISTATDVTYCFEITNTGQITLTSHTLVDDQLGLLLNDEPAAVGPGESYVYSTTVTVTSSVTNLATWTAADPFGNAAADSASASVLFVDPAILVAPLALSSSQPVNTTVQMTLTISNTGSGDLLWGIDENQVPAAVDSPQTLGEVLFQLNFGAQVGSDVLLGVEYDGSSFWVTAGGTTSPSEPNLLYQFDSAGALLNTFIQPTPAGNFGWRDLAFDGAFLYASDGSVIEQIDRATGQPTGTTIPSPESPARALAYDPATDHFWVANFGSQIYEIDRSGNIIQAHVNSVGSIYGLAWDDVSPGGPFLWAWTSESPPRAVQFSPVTGLPTGTSFTAAADPGGGGGGATITSALVPDRLVLIGMHQALSDAVLGYDLGVATGVCPANGLPWLGVSQAGGTVPQGGAADVIVTFDSNGLSLGVYRGHICILSNDPNNPLVVVPVELIASFGNDIYLPFAFRLP